MLYENGIQLMAPSSATSGYLLYLCLHVFLGPVVADDACPTLFNHVDEALVEIHVILSGFKLFPPCVALATSHEDKFSVCSSLYSIA